MKNVEISNSYISPYNYKDNMIIYIDETIANPRNKRIYKLNIVEKIIKLVNITQGKTLILFTSKGDL